MLANEILNNKFVPLQPTSPVSAALAKMDAWQTSSVPVIEPITNKLLGHILFDDVADKVDESSPVSELDIRTPIYTLENQHIFEVARQMLQHEVRMLSVIDHTETYLGVIEKKNVLEALTNMLNVTVDGSVITVRMAKSDFTLSELVHLIETEESRILGLTVEPSKELDAFLEVSIKVNSQETSAITSSLRRHGYLVTTSNRADLVQIDLSTRADELMRYLDV